MDARNISRQTFINTLNMLEREHSSSIAKINKMIGDASKNIKFNVKITKDVIPSIKSIGHALEQYYSYRGYSVFFNEGNEKDVIDPYIRINWNINDIAQPYEQ